MKRRSINSISSSAVPKRRSLRLSALDSLQYGNQRTVVSKSKPKHISLKYEKISVEQKPKHDPKLMKQPTDWEIQYNGIKEMRAKGGIASNAAVDSMGIETFADDKLQAKISRFHVLISAMLSSQTKDEANKACMDRLRAHGLNVENILNTAHSDLTKLLYGVGFHNNKTKYIIQTCNILKDNYKGDIPHTYDGLMALPGVGPKRWVKTWNHKSKSQVPEKTRKELESWLPTSHWLEINWLLVGFGQKICTPIAPKCKDCKISSICPGNPNGTIPK